VSLVTNAIKSGEVFLAMTLSESIKGLVFPSILNVFLFNNILMNEN